MVYRKCLVKSLLDKIDNSNDEFSSTIDVLDACYWIKNSWDQVSKTTIINCFNHAGYDVSRMNYDNNEDSIAMDQLSELVNIRNNKLKTSPEASISATEYVDIDKNVEPSFRCTSADFENEIIQNFLNEEDEEFEEIEENEVERREVITKEKFRAYLEGMKLYAIQHPTILPTIRQLEEVFLDSLFESNIQTKITNFFLIKCRQKL